MNHIFKKSDLDVVHITMKQLEEWTKDILLKETGMEHNVKTTPMS